MSPVPIDVLIPTWNNPEYLYPCVRSLLLTRALWPLHLYVVNNGHPDSVALPEDPAVTVIQTGGENLGWEGGLKAGLARSTSPYVVFSNDDILVPTASADWAARLLVGFQDPRVAAVGPASNVVMGMQNIFWLDPEPTLVVPFLIGFFIMLDRRALDAVGGVDASLPGGDDLDLALRFRAAGKRLLIKRDCFIYHHGFKTGQRIHGADWNSERMTEATDNALIRKHGLAAWESLYRPVDGLGGALLTVTA